MKAHPRRSATPAVAPRSTSLVSLLSNSEGTGAAPGSAAEVIEAELVDQTGGQLSKMSPDIASAVLDSYVDDRGRLVPAKSVEVAVLVNEDSAARMRRAQVLDTLRANAWADDTLKNYGHGLRAWRTWCDDQGIPALPLSPQLVADHLLDYGFLWKDGEVILGQDGNPQGRVSMGAIEMRLASLNKTAEFIGLPRPGDNEGFRALMRGMRRTLLTAPEHQKDALDHGLLMRCLAATNGRTFLAARLRAAVLLRVRARATAGQLARLQWADVVLTADEVTLELPPTSRHGATVSVTVSRHPTNPQVCLVSALHELRTLATGSGARLNLVLSHADGTTMTRQALHTMVEKALTSIGGWEASDVTDRDLGSALASECPATPFETTRDRALLLTGFWGALRRSNLSALHWRDVIDHGDDGIEVVLRRSKTDQEGKGESVFAPHGDATGDIPAPADALRAWRAELTKSLGRAPRDNEPVFVSLTPNGSIKVDDEGQLRRLSGDAINDVVQRLTVASGVAPRKKTGERHPYGAHSLRAGFVTEGAERGLTIPEIQSVTKHKNVDTLIGYVRQVNAKKKNGARKLFDQIG